MGSIEIKSSMYWHLQIISQAFGVIWLFLIIQCLAKTSRLEVVNQQNLRRYDRDSDLPYQVGNGNFAFNVDVTGLQTIKPFNTLSSWGWHSAAPPEAAPLKKRKDWREQIKVLIKDCWWLHEKIWDLNRVPHDNLSEEKPRKKPEQIATPIEPPPFLYPPKSISRTEWQRRNPHRMNLARIGFLWNGAEIEPSLINGTRQDLNLSTGIITSSFTIGGEIVTAETLVSPSIDAIGIRVQSEVMRSGNLTIYIDFPYPSYDEQADAATLGTFSMPGSHRTTFKTWGPRIEIKHELDDATYYYVNMQWDSGSPDATFDRISPYAHRYFFNTTTALAMQSEHVMHFSSGSLAFTPGYETLKMDSINWWKDYWSRGAFVDCSATIDPRAKEFQRRIILSQYYMAINAGGSDFAADSGLVSNADYGKTRPELAWWHFAHWARWAKWDRLGSTVPFLYRQALSSASEKAKFLGFEGAQWNGIGHEQTVASNSAAHLNSMWQQAHPFYFAELEYRAAPSNQTLEKWHDILEQSAKFMISYAKFNAVKKQYDLPASLHSMDMMKDDRHDDVHQNPIFELAYWRFGLDIMIKWYERQGLSVPANTTAVYDGLAPFPQDDESYVRREGVIDTWSNSTSVISHPVVAGLFGMLPPDPRLNMTSFQHTMAIIYEGWRITSNHTWDFPMLAMTAARSGDSNQAVDLLLHDSFHFNEAGLPIAKGSGIPHFSSSGGLLMAVAMLADGWTDSNGSHWPQGWTCESSGFNPGI